MLELGIEGAMRGAAIRAGNCVVIYWAAGAFLHTLGCGGGGAGSGASGGSDAGNSGPSGGSSGSSSGSSGGSSGSSSGSSGGSSGSSSGSSGGSGSSTEGGASGCIPASTQCAGASAIQSCGSNGKWGSPWTCATGTCANGACVGSTATAASCAASGSGLTDCGPGGSGTESCCMSLEVPGGTYYRTYTNDGDGGTGLVAPATVTGFRLDKYVVTVGRFRQYIDYLVDGGSPPA